MANMQFVQLVAFTGNNKLATAPIEFVPDISYFPRREEFSLYRDSRVLILRIGQLQQRPCSYGQPRAHPRHCARYPRIGCLRQFFACLTWWIHERYEHAIVDQSINSASIIVTINNDARASSCRKECVSCQRSAQSTFFCSKPRYASRRASRSNTCIGQRSSGRIKDRKIGAIEHCRRRPFRLPRAAVYCVAMNRLGDQPGLITLKSNSGSAGTANGTSMIGGGRFSATIEDDRPSMKPLTIPSILIVPHKELAICILVPYLVVLLMKDRD